VKVIDLQQILESKSWVGLGIAGNQAGHLQQAGEAQDFVKVHVAENAPKGMFPWYVSDADSFLSQNPLSSSEVKLAGKTKVQAEPEIALLVEFQYATEGEALLSGMEVVGFTVLNDLSNRIDAPKISVKKNWGECSQGLCSKALSLSDYLSPESEMNQWYLGCYLQRDGEMIEYGQRTSVAEYCYKNAQLVDWMTQQLNTQQDLGPLENLSDKLRAHKPKYGIIGIGATCYTEYGMGAQRFLREGDTIIVVATPDDRSLTPTALDSPDVLVLSQSVTS